MCKVWVKYTESNLFNCMKLWGKEKQIMNRFRILDDCSGRWLKLNQLFTEQNNGKNKSRILLNLSKQKIATLLSNSSKIMGNSCVSMLYWLAFCCWMIQVAFEVTALQWDEPACCLWLRWSSSLLALRLVPMGHQCWAFFSNLAGL